MHFGNKQNIAATHWTKDYAEHLRTVHFTLVAASVGLILLLSSSRPYVPVDALRELEEIMQLRKDWSAEWIKQFGELVMSKDGGTWIDSSGYPVSECKFIQVVESKTSALSLNRIYPVNVDEGWKSILGFQEHQGKGGMKVSSSYVDWSSIPNNLADFSKWWDGLIDVRFQWPWQYRDNGEIFLWDPITLLNGYPIGKFKCVNKPATSNLDGFIIRAGLQTPGRWDQPISVIFRNSQFVVPLSTGNWVIYRLKRDNFLKKFPHWKSEPFASSFRDLAMASESYEVLGFEDLRAHLYDQVKEGVQQFKVLGMEFPARQITIWGALIIVAVQVYLLVYLRRLSENLQPGDPAWDVAWIVMDLSRFARFISTITLTAVPVFAIALLFKHTLYQSERLNSTWRIWTWHKSSILSVILLGGALVICVSLAWLTWRYRPRLVIQKQSGTPQV